MGTINGHKVLPEKEFLEPSPIEELVEKQRLHEIKSKQFQTKIELAKLASTEIKRMLRILFIGPFFGMALSLLGFVLWYYKVQRWQDIMIRREAVPESSGSAGKRTDKKDSDEIP